MSLLKKIIFGSVLLACASTFAQQDPNRSFYRYNMNLVNPAYAGSHNGTETSLVGNGAELGLNLRSQWAGVEGAPETQTVFFSTGMGRNVGLGVSIVNDRTFIEEQTAITVDFSYRIKLSYETNLFLGLKAGGTSYDANTTGLTTFGLSQDPSLLNIDGGFKPVVGVGALLKGEDFFIALSSPNVTTTERLEQNDGQVRLGDSRIHAYLSGGYDVPLNRRVVFKPSILLRYVDAAPLSLDLTAALHFNKRFELGASYRVQEGVSGLLLFNASDSIDIGYGYETPFDSPVVSATNGTHEVFLKFKI